MRWHLELRLGPRRDHNYSVWTSVTESVGGGGTTSLQYGPFALGEGASSVYAYIPPYPWSCEHEAAWKVAPFDASPLHARFGALSALATASDGNVMLAPEGEVGDVMKRIEDEYWSDTPSYWELHEDVSAILPDFVWPLPGYSLNYEHEDINGLEGYADYARSNAATMDGRLRKWNPETCF